DSRPCVLRCMPYRRTVKEAAVSNERSEDNRPEGNQRTPRSAIGSAEVERSRFSPAPLAGADPRPGHTPVQGEVEEMLDEALIAAEENEQAGGAISNEAPALVSAVL